MPCITAGQRLRVLGISAHFGPYEPFTGSIHAATQLLHKRPRSLVRSGAEKSVPISLLSIPKGISIASVLLHELVHYRQSPHYFYYPAAQEEAACHLKDEWLRERRLRANVNWIAVVLEAGCTPKDIHPD